MQWIAIAAASLMFLAFIVYIIGACKFGPIAWVLEEQKRKDWGEMITLKPDSPKTWKEQETEQFEAAERNLLAYLKRHPTDQRALKDLKFIKTKLARKELNDR